MLFPERLHVSRSLRKRLRQACYTVTFNHAFDQVVQACAETPRHGQHGTWITPAMQVAYNRLHHLGHAHSVECWADGTLVGGLYGLAIGRVFFGESMFAHASDASKVAFVHLVERLRREGYRLIDCQVETDHLRSLGAEPIPRRSFVQLLERECGGAT